MTELALPISQLFPQSAAKLIEAPSFTPQQFQVSPETNPYMGYFTARFSVAMLPPDKRRSKKRTYMLAAPEMHGTRFATLLHTARHTQKGPLDVHDGLDDLVVPRKVKAFESGASTNRYDGQFAGLMQRHYNDPTIPFKAFVERHLPGFIQEFENTAFPLPDFVAKAAFVDMEVFMEDRLKQFRLNKWTDASNAFSVYYNRLAAFLQAHETYKKRLTKSTNFSALQAHFSILTIYKEDAMQVFEDFYASLPEAEKKQFIVNASIPPTSRKSAIIDPKHETFWTYNDTEDTWRSYPPHYIPENPQVAGLHNPDIQLTYKPREQTPILHITDKYGTTLIVDLQEQQDTAGYYQVTQTAYEPGYVQTTDTNNKGIIPVLVWESTGNKKTRRILSDEEAEARLGTPDAKVSILVGAMLPPALVSGVNARIPSHRPLHYHASETSSAKEKIKQGRRDQPMQEAQIGVIYMLEDTRKAVVQGGADLFDTLERYVHTTTKTQKSPRRTSAKLV